jgi:hypothetical protein
MKLNVPARLSIFRMLSNCNPVLSSRESTNAICVSQVSLLSTLVDCQLGILSSPNVALMTMF